MKEFAEWALDAAGSAGIREMEVRVVEDWNEEVELRNNVPTRMLYRESRGIGIKVYQQAGWGFASTSKLSRDAIRRCVRQAETLAAASQTKRHLTWERVPEEVHVARWELPIHHNPFDVPLDEKLTTLSRLNTQCAAVKGVHSVVSRMHFHRRHQYFANLQGSQIEQIFYLSGVGFAVIAANDREQQVRSYPNSFGGQFAAMGYEVVYLWPLLENAERIAEEAVALLTAPECPSGTYDVILDGSQMAMQLHETFGHAVELDRVLGYEANFAGTSYLRPEMRNKLQFASPGVTIYADSMPSQLAGAGTYAFDDEGVQAQRTELVRNGIFRNYLYSRDLAGAIQAPRSNGCARAAGWNRVPLIRQTNVCLEPGDWELEALIADTKEGLFMQTNKSWSIDDRRQNFQFGTEIAWEIKNGKRTRMLRNPTYSGLTMDFWNKCDAVCDKNHWIMWGLPQCGKGQPEQLLAISHGTAPARFRHVQVGA